MSSRQHRICVDKDLCQGHGVCAAEAPGLFAVTDQGQIYDTVELLVEYIDDDQLALAQRAQRFCPNGVIRIEPVEE